MTTADRKSELYRSWVEYPVFDEWGRQLSFERFLREYQARAMTAARQLSGDPKVREYLRLHNIIKALEAILNEELKNPTRPLPGLYDP